MGAAWPLMLTGQTHDRKDPPADHSSHANGDQLLETKLVDRSSVFLLRSHGEGSSSRRCRIARMSGWSHSTLPYRA